MKKVLKWVGIILGVLLLVVAGLAAWVNFGPVPTYDIVVVQEKVEVTPARVERGFKIAALLCVGCHYSNDTRQLTGRTMEDVPPEFGVFKTKNITQDPDKGIGKWTDGEIISLLRTNVNPKTGHVPFPMVSLHNVADEDIRSIVAFLRSDHPLVQANPAEDYDTELAFLGKFLSKIAFKPTAMPTAPIAPPDTTNKVVWGKYLVRDLIQCWGCHSGDLAALDYQTPENSARFLGGGAEMLDVNGRKIQTSNLTFDKETGIGNWTVEQFGRAVRENIRADNSIISTPMFPHKELTDSEIAAMYEYLKTLTPMRLEKKPVPMLDLGPNPSMGKVAFHKYQCVSCHGTTGLGYFDLRQAHDKYPDDSTLRDVILNNGNYFPGTRMPQWNGALAEEHIQPLIDYVRELGKAASKGKK